MGFRSCALADDSGAVRVEGRMRVCMGETYPLVSLLDSEPSAEQWREAVAECADLMLRDQMWPFTTSEAEPRAASPLPAAPHPQRSEVLSAASSQLLAVLRGLGESRLPAELQRSLESMATEQLSVLAENGVEGTMAWLQQHGAMGQSQGRGPQYQQSPHATGLQQQQQQHGQPQDQVPLV
ncbi:hypothetical protein GPECTOR_25g442 [Gonium pectorale]|uniref:Uncharacterized protein n=1 Tax=Gonium pectorale TaxID=33097 RepID=A0A150GG92_GONPE|nr:hypothetical protein GPECTOR_25g442 [Gonium pectorale]|eukprot:KXZ48857.1 hypothetical protein GPECTOR_25g442 [Gonium pectorale]